MPRSPSRTSEMRERQRMAPCSAGKAQPGTIITRIVWLPFCVTVSVWKTPDQAMAKMEEKLRGFKYDRMKLRHTLLARRCGEQEEVCRAREIEPAEKKSAKGEREPADEGKATQGRTCFARSKMSLRGSRRSAALGKAALKRDQPPRREDRGVHAAEVARRVRRSRWSPVRYLDPSLLFFLPAWCKKHDVPIEKIFSKDAVDEMCVKSGFDPFGTVMIAFVVVVVGNGTVNRSTIGTHGWCYSVAFSFWMCS
ncbi:hypothetical protein DFH94DRAFT_807137 [Russula ochroleuca]|uniref:Topoisomerase I C-terminal domain-containing protein n=1 Tax=Russula ochroleuca TaxID=152965 RepID=A0A9P5K0U3_9AGAM|nr:hypothetical protein DFH94DRAFT_807137 [Russula ochroleuca]